jgi:hypothetical protein
MSKPLAGVWVDTFMVTEEIDYLPYALLKVGEFGRIVHSDDYDFFMRMEAMHPGLHRWNNEVTLPHADLRKFQRVRRI